MRTRNCYFHSEKKAKRNDAMNTIRRGQAWVSHNNRDCEAKMKHESLENGVRKRKKERKKMELDGEMDGPGQKPV